MSDRIVEVIWEFDKDLMDNTELYVKATEKAKLPHFPKSTISFKGCSKILPILI